MRAGTMASVGTGLAASVIAHLMLLIAVAVPHSRQTTHGEAVAVELVSAEEAAPAFNDSPAQAQPQPKPEPQPDWSQLQTKPPAQNSDAPSQSASPPQTPANRQRTAANQQAAQQPQAQQPQAQQSQAQPQRAQPQQVQPPPQQQQQEPPQQAASEQQPEPSEPPAESLAEQGTRLAALLALPPPGGGTAFGSEAEVKADLLTNEMAAFKAHLKKCWTLPPGYSDTQQIKVIVRVALRRDGRLAADPEAIEVTPAKLGGPLWINAKAALQKCQPYSMLPAEKYKEWRVLDLNFSPDKMAGG